MQVREAVAPVDINTGRMMRYIVDQNVPAIDSPGGCGRKTKESDNDIGVIN